MANGVLVFSPEIPGFHQVFSDNEIVYFKDHNDFQDKVKYYLENENERIKIAKSGWEKTHALFNEKITTLINLTFYKNEIKS